VFRVLTGSSELIFFILIKGKFIEAIHDGLRVILFLKKKNVIKGKFIEAIHEVGS